MAVPTNDTYARITPGNIGGGRAAPPRTAAWYSSATAGQWVALPNSTLSGSAAGWSGQTPGIGTFPAVVAYSSSIVNTVGVRTADGVFRSGTWWINWGGGHGDYGGNELYAYGPLEDDSPAYHRLTDPTLPAPNDVARASSMPVSRHTYDVIQFDAARNRLLCLSAPASYPNANSFNTVDYWDFDARTWSAGPDVTTNQSAGPLEGFSAIDATYMWLLTQGNENYLNRYTLATNTVTAYQKNFPAEHQHSKAGYDAARGVLAWFAGAGVVHALDLRDPVANSEYLPTVTGTGPSGTSLSLEWDPGNGRFFAYAGGNGRTLHFLTPGANPYQAGDAWAWSSVTPSAGATPADTPAEGSGVWGRFRYIACGENGAQRGVIVQPVATSPLYLYKPAS